MTDTNATDPRILQWCQAARSAGRDVARASSKQKNAILTQCAKLLEQNQQRILDANAQDLKSAQRNGMSSAMLDRLRLDKARIHGMAKACVEVAALADPVGQVDGIVQRPSGIRVGRMRAPLGTLLIIYESRPNVTIEAAALSIKAGNACILRGGKEALHSNQVLVDIFRQAITPINAEAIQFVDDPNRDLLYAMLKQQDLIDLVIPRGGTSLIRAVVAASRIPVVQHYQGICHVYVDSDADLQMAEAIVRNGKLQRPGVCNAVEGIIVHAKAAKDFLPKLSEGLHQAGVELRGDSRACALSAHIQRAGPNDFDREFLDLILAIKVVDSLDEALDFIDAHGSHHTETIVTDSHSKTQRFLHEVDASCVLVNASTRFNDGGELGLGAEIGISTTKVHAYGPMGLEGLTCQKFIVYGTGETRA